MTLPGKHHRPDRPAAPLRRPAARLALVAAGLALAAHAAAAPVAGLGTGADAAQRALSERPLRSLEGGTLTLGSLRGQVVVVNFWASWCPPCRRELPRLAGLHRRLATQGARVVAVSIDSDVENARRFLRQQGLALPAVHDGPRGLARELDLKSVPLTLVLDRDGRVAYTTSRSDEAAVAEVGRVAQQLLSGGAASVGTDGGAR